MWLRCLIISVACVLFALGFYAVEHRLRKRSRANILYIMMAGVFAATFVLFLPVYSAKMTHTVWGYAAAVFMSLFSAVRIFSGGCKISDVQGALAGCADRLGDVYTLWASILFVVALFLTVGFVLSFFKNISAYLKYIGLKNRDIYVFSQLNSRSLALARDIRANHEKAGIVFTDAYRGSKENAEKWTARAATIGAVCFKKPILAVNFKKHNKNKTLYLFTIGEDEMENVDLALRLIDGYKTRAHTNLYVFSQKLESELLLTAVDKGVLKVRRINEVQSLVNRILFEQGQVLFESAREVPGSDKHICAVVVGLGNRGTEMLKALTWFGQMDGYRLELHGFDKDPLAKEKFTVMAPELMDEKYNGVDIPGEARYQIEIHPGMEVQGLKFVQDITAIADATYIFVALGNDDVNIRTAVRLRMYYARLGKHPVIQAVVYDSRRKKALEGICNYSNQAYDIQFLGDTDSSYAERVILDSELEEQALQRHLKWGAEAGFWTYEYNYRSSAAAAIHMRARVNCGIAGADKKEEDLTPQEREIIESLEHRRWNAYMRSEGYVYSGSKDKSSRNDLAKMHHDLVEYEALDDAEKRKDSRIGTN